jgi:hypothetical protein
MERYRLTKNYNTCEFHGGGNGNKECSAFPDLPSIIDTDKDKIDRIIAIGDIHGDLDLAIGYMEVAELIKRVYEEDENGSTVTLFYKDEKVKRIYKWIGKRTVAVQVGDQVDRCRPYNHECHVPEATINDEASDVTIMFFYYELHVAALKVDCAVYSLLGNHELLNVLGNMKYVSHKGLTEFPSKTTDLFKGRIDAFSVDSKKKTFKDQSSLSEFMGCTRLSSIIVDNYLFVHAGIMERLINYTNKSKKVADRNSVKTINDLVGSWLLNNNTDGDKVFIMKLLAGKFMSPFWPRIFGTIKTNLELESEECKKYVKPVLNLLNLKGIVVGHTPQLKNNINSTCSNTVWRVDIAGSQAFDEVLFDGVSDEKEKQKLQKGRETQVLEITLGRNGKEDSFQLLPKSLN